MSFVCVPVQNRSYLELVSFLKKVGSDREPAQAVEDAIDYWLENASWKTADLLPETVRVQDGLGYSWRVPAFKGLPSATVFLPHGTKLRIAVAGRYKYAEVAGDHLVFEDEKVSPNQFARKATGTARDAWRDVSLRRPNDHSFRPADELREEVRPSQ